jgi:hypothetical protein
VIARAHFGRVLFVEDNERLQRAMLFSIMRVFGLWGTLLAPTIVVADAPSTAIPNQTVTAPQIVLTGTASTLRPVLDRGKP